ncbi:iron ABC transporter permease [Halosimplex litoreum]|uniref:Iron ABC transporter permease n=1 Tax=Halosimplex litoreum TaxID=1198301 RepID=A0A7T3KVI8_9EURY|nr:iron ABC transporter permease [Halosimplex litoreum]QPV63043.1 iron ABC transporter permease [Halosimplex litoreum]
MRVTRVAERLTAPALAVATLVLLSLLFFYPVGIVLVEAVRVDGVYTLATVVEVLRDPFFFGVFAQALSDPTVLVESFPDYRLGLFGFTAYQALLSTVAAIALGLPGAYVLARFEFPGRKTIRSLTALPFVMPTILVAIGFVATFGANGVITGVVQALGIEVSTFTGTLGIIVLAHAFYDAPLIARITAASWEGIDAEMTETARSLGASPLRSFRDVVVPQLLPAILTGALLTFIFSFMSFAIVLALGGLSKATVEVWVYHRISQLDYGTASTLATMEMLFSLALTYAYLRYEARQRATSAARPPDRIDLVGPATRRRLFAWGYAVVAVVVFVVPIVSLVYSSLTGPEGLTLRNYRFLVERQTSAYAFQVKPLTAVTNSLVFGAGTLLLAVPMGVFLAVVSTRQFRGRKLIDTLSMAPFAVSGVVVGLGLLRGWVFGTEAFGYRFTVTGGLAIVAAHAVGAYPFVTRNVAPALAGIDGSIVESARSLGASRARVMLDIELPLVVPAVLAGTAFAFAISIGEFDSTVILATGDSSYTMPVAIERFIGRRLGPATAMGVVLLVVTSVSFVIIDRLGEGSGFGG